MTSAEFTALLVLATVSSFTPGPNTALSAALAANRGLRGSLHFVLAVPVGWGLLFTLCAAGVGTLVVTVPALYGAVLLGGVAYLLWLASRLAVSGALAQVDERRLNVSFAQGVALQFVNIKAWMLALSIVAGWIAGKPDAAWRFSVVLPVLMAYGLLSNLSYALIGSGLRGWLAQGRRLLVFNRCMAAALVLTAGWMLWSAP